LDRFAYTPYGVVETLNANWTHAASPIIPWAVLFRGYFADEGTGLLHARARQYSPTLGRFVGRDSAGYVDGASLYAAYFVPDGRDPTGNVDWDDDGVDWITQDGTGPINIPNEPGRIPWGQPGQNVLAVTIPRIDAEFDCDKEYDSQGCPCWRLDQVDIEFRVEVLWFTRREYRRRSVDRDWVRRAENDHVQDFQNWATNIGKPLADQIEQQLKSTCHCTESACEQAAEQRYRTELQASVRTATQQTINTHDATGLHTYGGTNQRP
jgi:RHS repeat-associated protein